MFRNRTQLRVESLDGRILPSAAPSSVTAHLANGTLTITGTNLADNVQVSYFTSHGIDTSRVSILSRGQYIKEFARSQVRTVVFNGNDGDDYFSNSLDIYTVARGGIGKDILSVSGRANWLDGGDGDDRLSSGGPGSHVLIGSDGNDTLKGSDGNDTLYGGNGGDTLYGFKGRDLLVGDSTTDTKPGNDILYGGENDDTLRGGAGHDRLYGGRDKDLLYGDAGNDYLNGCEPDFKDFVIDVLYGGDGTRRTDYEKDAFVTFYEYGFGARAPKNLVADPELPRDYLDGLDVNINPPR